MFASVFSDRANASRNQRAQLFERRDLASFRPNGSGFKLAFAPGRKAVPALTVCAVASDALLTNTNEDPPWRCSLRGRRCCNLYADFAAPAEPRSRVDIFVDYAVKAFAGVDFAAVGARTPEAIGTTRRFPAALWILFHKACNGASWLPLGGTMSRRCRPTWEEADVNDDQQQRDRTGQSQPGD